MGKTCESVICATAKTQTLIGTVADRPTERLSLDDKQIHG